MSNKHSTGSSTKNLNLRNHGPWRAAYESLGLSDGLGLPTHSLRLLHAADPDLMEDDHRGQTLAIARRLGVTIELYRRVRAALEARVTT